MEISLVALGPAFDSMLGTGLLAALCLADRVIFPFFFFLLFFEDGWEFLTL